MKTIGNYLAQNYVKKNIIDSQFCEIYSYIFDYIISFTLYNCSLLVIGFISFSTVQTLIYIIITGAVRSISGGYHCKKQISCLFLSYSIFAIYIFLNAINIYFSISSLLFCFFICCILLILKSPVDNPNNRFTAIMKNKARKKLLVFLIFDSLFIQLLFWLNCNKYILSNNLCLIICIVGLYVGHFANKRQQNES